MTDSTECIFCGRPWADGVNHSEQHILGNRLRKHAADLPNARFSAMASLLLDPETQQFVASPATEPCTRASSLLNLRTRDVCQDCNNRWMKRLEEEATPHFLALADAAKHKTNLSLSRAEAKCFARRMQVLALTHELTARGPRVSNSTMGMRLGNGDALRDAQVWLAQSQDDLGIQVRQAHLAISLSPIVRPGDPEHLSLMLALSWFHLSVLIYIPDVPGQRQGPNVNGQVAVPGGGQLKVPTPRVDHFLFRAVPPRARASRMRNESPAVTTTLA